MKLNKTFLNEIEQAMILHPSCLAVTHNQLIYDVPVDLLITLRTEHIHRRKVIYGQQKIAICTPFSNTTIEDLQEQAILFRRADIAMLHVLKKPKELWTHTTHYRMTDLERYLHRLFLGRVFYHEHDGYVRPVRFRYDWIVCTREEYSAMKRGNKLYTPEFKDIVHIAYMQPVLESSRLLRTNVLLWSTEKYPYDARRYPKQSETDLDLERHMRQAYREWRQKQQSADGHVDVSEDDAERAYKRSLPLDVQFEMAIDL